MNLTHEQLLLLILFRASGHLREQQKAVTVESLERYFGLHGVVLRSACRLLGLVDGFHAPRTRDYLLLLAAEEYVRVILFSGNRETSLELRKKAKEFGGSAYCLLSSTNEPRDLGDGVLRSQLGIVDRLVELLVQ